MLKSRNEDEAFDRAGWVCGLQRRHNMGRWVYDGGAEGSIGSVWMAEGGGTWPCRGSRLWTDGIQLERVRLQEQTCSEAIHHPVHQHGPISIFF